MLSKRKCQTPAIVEKVADFVTLRVEEEGIPFALKHYGIIE